MKVAIVDCWADSGQLMQQSQQLIFGEERQGHLIIVSYKEHSKDNLIFFTGNPILCQFPS